MLKNRKEFLIKYKDKFWHELSQTEINEIVKCDNLTVDDILVTLKQPIWCTMYEALTFKWGCWSLCDTTPDCARANMSKTQCNSCEFSTSFKEK